MRREPEGASLFSDALVPAVWEGLNLPRNALNFCGHFLILEELKEALPGS